MYAYVTIQHPQELNKKTQNGGKNHNIISLCLQNKIKHYLLNQQIFITKKYLIFINNIDDLSTQPSDLLIFIHSNKLVISGCKQSDFN